MPKQRKETPFLREQQLLDSWRQDHTLFVEQAILEPYRRATGHNVKPTKQQLAASKALSSLVNSKVKRFRNEATPAELETARKIGVSIQAGKGLGKDAWLSWAIIWFVSLFPNCKVPCISVSADQLHKVLWSEIAKWLQYSAVNSWLHLQNDKLYFTDLPENIVGKRWFAFPKAANPKATEHEQTETLSGVHEDYTMVCVDEASGVPDGVFESLEGVLTKGVANFFLLIFNPTRSKGYAIDTQNVASADWLTLHWNGEDSEIADKTEHERLEKRYGRDSNPYRVRVLGLPPVVDESVLIPWDWIEEAVNKEIEGNEKLPLIEALDCGAGGDKSILCRRRGYQVYPLKRLQTPDSAVLVNWAGAEIDENHPDTLFVDTIGIGWAVEGDLRSKKGAIVEPADARRTADNSDKYFNKRAEMYDRVREAFEKGYISIPDDPDLKDQLSTIKCEYVGTKMKILDKKKIKAVLGHSPDEADALALTFYRVESMFSKKTAAPPKLLAQPVGANTWLRA